jgi:hypothetical protein
MSLLSITGTPNVIVPEAQSVFNDNIHYEENERVSPIKILWSGVLRVEGSTLKETNLVKL